MGIGKRIKEARDAKHWTQKELAEQIGVTPSAITNYENETSHPKEEILYRLINKLSVDANFLFQDYISTISEEKNLFLLANFIIYFSIISSFSHKSNFSI